MSFSGSSDSRCSSWATTRLAIWSSIGVPMNTIRSESSREKMSYSRSPRESCWTTTGTRGMPGNIEGMPPAPALELRGLTKRYDDGLLALDRLDLDIPDGEFFGLLGPNGAGKTTLISAVCNLIRITAGQVRVFGHDHGSHAARALVGLAEQDVNLDRFLD